MEQDITRRSARSQLIWWAAYILLVLSMIASTSATVRNLSRARLPFTGRSV